MLWTIIISMVGAVTKVFTKKTLEVLSKTDKKPEPPMQNYPRKEPTINKSDNKDSLFTTNYPEHLDYDRKLLLFNKLIELEKLLTEFKDILQDTPVNAIRAKPPTRQDDM